MRRSSATLSLKAVDCSSFPSNGRIIAMGPKPALPARSKEYYCHIDKCTLSGIRDHETVENWIVIQNASLATTAIADAIDVVVTPPQSDSEGEGRARVGHLR